MEVFYYNKRQLFLLSFFNVVMLFSVVCISNFFDSFLWWNAVVTVLCLASLSASLFVTLFPQKLAIVSAEGIKIDHNELLKWEDIETAQKVKPSKLSRRYIILFETKPGCEYNHSLMQKISKKSSYGAFSIPLYAMTKADREKIEEAISKYIKIN